MINPRKVALNILIEYERNGTYTNLALKKHLREIDNVRDKKFISALTYGVIEKKILLDYYISKVSSVKLKKINVVVLNILRMGLYQIIYMSTPESAACNTSVELAKTNGQFKSSGFVNAVLRKLAKTYSSISLPKKDSAEYYSVKYSISLHIVDVLFKSLGKEGFCDFFDKASLSSDSMFAAVNLKKITQNDLLLKLETENVKAELTELTGLIKIVDTINIESSESFKEGLFHIIGFPSYIAALAAVPKTGETVFDMCSAPGGKTFSIAYNSDRTNRIFAFDVHKHKIENIEKSSRRLGLTNVIPSVWDGTVFCEEFSDSADIILCDVPCSGLGIMFKKPDIKYKDIEFDSLICTQYKILSNAAKYLKSGGRLVYSTCTVNPDENSNLVKTFLNENTDFQIDEKFQIYKDFYGEHQFLPNEVFSDGFYIAVISKK